MYARYYPPMKSHVAQKSSVAAPPEPASVAAFSARPAPSLPTEMPYARYIPPSRGVSSIAPEHPPLKKTVFNDDDISSSEPKKKRKRDEDDTGASTDNVKKKSKKVSKEDLTRFLKDRDRAEKKGAKEEKTRKKEGRSKTKKARKFDADATNAGGEPMDRMHIDDASEDKADNRDTPAADVQEEAHQGPSVKGKSEPDIGATADAKQRERREKQEKREKIEKKKKKIKEVVQDEAQKDGAAQVSDKHKSVFERREKALKVAAKSAAKRKQEEAERSEMELENSETAVPGPEPTEEHGLKPLPQPAPAIKDDAKIEYDTLPPWLTFPIQVSGETKAPFVDLGIPPKVSQFLGKRGMREAFAVQTAAIPMLMPTAQKHGDMVISAATGSGKTLAYVLPMVYDISHDMVTRLRGIVVLPTRDLVQQVKLACEESCSAFAAAGGHKVKIGMAVGSKSFKEEQQAIMGSEQRYDPEGYAKQRQRAGAFLDADYWKDGDGEEKAGMALNRSEKTLPDHIMAHFPKIEILICTPGRLVNHINDTPGFTLDYVRWLIVDEADKLLSQGYQQWLELLLAKLGTGEDKLGARDFAGCNDSGVRKVVLSATITRDLTLLDELRLRKPSMVVLGEELRLPDGLKEAAIKVRDSYFKTLYLVDLLRSEYMVPVNGEPVVEKTDRCSAPTKPKFSESGSDFESSDRDSSDSDSESGLDLDGDADADFKSTTTPNSRPTSAAFPTSVLIFTQSNDSALRLSRLLSLLCPDLAPLLGTLTSATPTARHCRTLNAFARGTVRILVASDVVARGIDLQGGGLDHVVNYDVPISVAAYIHRVGRTARAGRKGRAWTLVEHAHARRFWRDFVGEGKGAESKIVRGGTVEKVVVGAAGEFGEERKKEYEGLLERLEWEVGERRRHT